MGPGSSRRSGAIMRGVIASREPAQIQIWYEAASAIDQRWLRGLLEDAVTS